MLSAVDVAAVPLPGHHGDAAALLRSRLPLNSTVELVTRRQNGQTDGVGGAGARASRCSG